MTPVVQQLNEPQMGDVASYFGHNNACSSLLGRYHLAGAEHAAELIQRGDPSRQLPACNSCHGNHVGGPIRAFNAILAKDLLDPVVLPNGARRALPIAGDDAAPKAVVAALQADFGYDTIDAGPLADSWRFERAKPAYCIPLDKDGLVSSLAAAERDKDLPDGSWRR